MKYLMHRQSKDVAIQVSDILYQDAQVVQVIGHWICLGYTGKPWPLTRPDVITISNKKEWLEMTEELISKKRNKPGLPE